MMKEITVELQLVDGNKVIRTFDLDKVYGIAEKQRSFWKLSSKFPFFQIESKRYVKFRYRTQYTLINDVLDDSYAVDCDLHSFCKLMHISYGSFSDAVLKSAIEG